MEHTDLRTPVRLAFANHMNRFVTGDGAPSSPEWTKMLACAHPAFELEATDAAVGASEVAGFPG
jgi:hypothetical protein